MGLTIVRETEDGTSLGSVEDPSNLLHRLLPSPKDTAFQVLRFIDRYSDTVINRPQLEPFLEEWGQIAQVLKPKKSGRCSLGFVIFAAQAQEEVQTYLKFYGD
jgi:hypothetical protein